jgi:O-antigen biosynthesis protein
MRQNKVAAQIEKAKIQFHRRSRQLRRILSTEGPRGVGERVRSAAGDRWFPKSVALPVKRCDVLAADVTRHQQPRLLELTHTEPLIVNWVTIPAGPRSGGHTTMFRMIRYLQSRGCRNRLYFYNVYGGDHAYYESIARSFYKFDGEVLPLDGEMQDAHAVFATSWPTAYPVFNSRCAGKRFYFAQDFEPWFYPTGAVGLLAENTYRMGFHAITAGRWLAEKLHDDFAMNADYFDFGCDTSCYRLEANSARTGIAFYARPDTARRGFELGLMALELFAARCPKIEIHLYGNKVGKLPFPAIDHGSLMPHDLNQIYNKCFAGLSLSLTNASLTPHEMLASGCIPVVNDAEHNRIVLNNPFVHYSACDPHALAAALESLVNDPQHNELSVAASQSVHSVSWDSAGEAVFAALQHALEAQPVEQLR